MKIWVDGNELNSKNTAPPIPLIYEDKNSFLIYR